MNKFVYNLGIRLQQRTNAAFHGTHNETAFNFKTPRTLFETCVEKPCRCSFSLSWTGNLVFLGNEPKQDLSRSPGRAVGARNEQVHLSIWWRKFQNFGDCHARSIFEFRVIVVLPSGRGVYLSRWHGDGLPNMFLKSNFDLAPFCQQNLPKKSRTCRETAPSRPLTFWKLLQPCPPLLLNSEYPETLSEWKNRPIRDATWQISGAVKHDGEIFNPNQRSPLYCVNLNAENLDFR